MAAGHSWLPDPASSKDATSSVSWRPLGSGGSVLTTNGAVHPRFATAIHMVREICAHVTRPTSAKFQV